MSNRKGRLINHAKLRCSDVALTKSRWGLFIAIVPLVSACATVPLKQGGSLASYADMRDSNGMLTKSKFKIQKDAVLAAKTVRILETSYAQQAAAPQFNAKQRTLISNSIDRALCINLSDRFVIVGANEPADMTVRATITHATPTDEVAAGASKVVGFVPTLLSVNYPVPVPRIPLGLGTLSVEAEARSASNSQHAAMIWGRAADAVTSRPRMSAASDAYDLGTSFGEDFSKLLTTGETPFGGTPSPSLPAMHKVTSVLGGAPKHAACEAFGRSPGVVGFGADVIGLPPEWIDDGPKTASTATGTNVKGP